MNAEPVSKHAFMSKTQLYNSSNFISAQEFDGYKFRDLIVAQWGAAYDVQIKREMWLGKPMIFFNVMWKYLGQQSFHMSEQEYLEHLQVCVDENLFLCLYDSNIHCV